MSTASTLTNLHRQLWRAVAGAPCGLSAIALVDHFAHVLDAAPLMDHLDRLVMGRYVEKTGNAFEITQDCRVPAGEAIPAWLSKPAGEETEPSPPLAPLPAVPVFLAKPPRPRGQVRSAFLSLFNEGENLNLMMLIARGPVVGLSDMQVRSAIKNCRLYGFIDSAGSKHVHYFLTETGVKYRRENELPPFPPPGWVEPETAAPHAEQAHVSSPLKRRVSIDTPATTTAGDEPSGDFECSVNSRGALFIQSGPYTVDLPPGHVKQLVRFLSSVDFVRVMPQIGRVL